MSLFEKASRAQLRFQAQRGILMVEDLWSLPLNQLDDIAKSLNKQVRAQAEEESFIPASKSTKATTEANNTALAFEIVKHIINVKVQERDERATAAERAEKKQKLLALLAKRDEADLESKSREDLEKMIADL